MRVLVTGGTGYIGYELVKELVKNGHQVHLLYRSENKLASFPEFGSSEQIHCFKGTVEDKDAIAKAIEGCRQVYHLAGLARTWDPDPQAFYNSNLKGTQNILKASIDFGIEKLVFTSTGGTLAPSLEGPPSDENTPRITPFYNEYERTKWIAEEEVIQYAQKGLNTVIVNPPRVYGPGLASGSNAVTLLIDQYRKGKWRFVLGDGSPTGNYTYVQDVVQGHLLAMKYGRSGHRYILGGENLSLNQLFEKIAQVTGKRYRMFGIPVKLAVAFAKFQTWKASVFGTPPAITPEWVVKFSKNWACSSGKAKAELGYQITPSDQALKSTYEWILSKDQA